MQEIIDYTETKTRELPLLHAYTNKKTLMTCLPPISNRIAVGAVYASRPTRRIKWSAAERAIKKRRTQRCLFQSET